jgi:Cu-Zn family superoxide dismutase
MQMNRALISLFALGLASSAGAADLEKTASAAMQSREGKALGTVKLTQMPKGVIMRVEMNGLSPGWHAIHIHSVGKCEPPFTTAGDHFNPSDHKHGFAEGPHEGDLPNIFADTNGQAATDMVTDRVSLVPGSANPGAFVLGPNGTSVIVHAAQDDYKTDPAGNSGDRIACGVIK